MISLLKNYITEDHQRFHDFEHQATQADEAQLIQLIYRFAGKKDEWFNLLLSLSNCIAIYDSLPQGHPYQGVSQRLLSHLKNAIKISGRLNSSAYTLLNNQTLDQLPIPAGIMAASGRVVEINNRALSLIDQLPQWSIQDQCLRFSNLNIKEKIQQLIESEEDFCSFPLVYQDAADAVSFNFAGTDSPDNKQLYLSQIPNPIEPSQPYIYFCFNTRSSSFIDTEKLKHEYQLTETESLVVITLLEEVTTSKTAKKLKLKEITVRGHLSNIYIKMDVTRKPELIRKIMLRSLNQATQNSHFFNSTAELENHEAWRSSKQKCLSLKSFTLKDQRQLSYLDVSYCNEDEVKDVIVVLHNMMGSAFELPPSVAQVLKEKNIRVLIPERPGYGDSTRCDSRTHQDFSNDLKQLLEHLEIPKIKVIAHSIGGAYALAMAEFIPEKIERIAMVNAVTRIEDMLAQKPIPVLISAVYQSMRFAPFLIEPILRMAVGKDLEHFYSQQLNFLRPTKEGRAADINLLNQPDFRKYSLKNLKQSAKQGIQIWSDELKLSFAEWKFNVTNKDMEYQFWHGDEDDVISVHAAIRLANELNTQCFFRLKYETHYLFPRHIEDVIKELVSPGQTKSEETFQSVSIKQA